MKHTLPTIHTNGTSRSDLVKGYEDAYYALGHAIKAIESIEFNARDYYVQGTDAWPIARNARALNLDRLRQVNDYLGEHLAHLSAQ